MFFYLHKVVTNEFGEGLVEVTPSEQGTYKVQANYGKEKAESVFAVSSRTPELFDLQPNTTLMKALVENYPGEALYVPFQDWQDPLLNDSALRKVPKRTMISLGYAPIVFALLAILGSLAWFIRRRSGGR